MDKKPEKKHWAKRAMEGLNLTLDFINEYTPKVINAGFKLSVLAFAGVQAVLMLSPEASIAAQVAGAIGSSIFQMKEMWEQLVDTVTDDSDNSSEVESLRAQVNEYRELIADMNESADEQNTAMQGLIRALETQSQSHNALLKTNEQMQEALRFAHASLLEQAEARGEISRKPFDPDNDSFVQQESDQTVSATTSTKEVCLSEDDDDPFMRMG